MTFILSLLFFLMTNLQTALCSADTLTKIQQRGYLLWGADSAGGAPYIFPDPHDPSKFIGFEVEIAGLIAQKMGVQAKHVQASWESLFMALQRSDFDIAMNGIEITPERKQHALFSRPYYNYSNQLVVRKNETRIKTLQDLVGKKAGTLSATVSQNILQSIPGIEVKLYPSQVEPYEDLALERIDGVLLDMPIAAYYAKPNPLLRFEGDPIGEGYYGIAMRKEDVRLKEVIDLALEDLLKNGELEKIYKKWEMWNEKQKNLLQIIDPTHSELEQSRTARFYTFIPPLLRGACTTIALSVISMALAVGLGLMLTLTRLYGHKIFASAASAYVEIYRGTPLLIQLYLLYYGLPNIGITLGPVLAAFLGLGMNYAAYESEIYRAGINSVPKGQMEAALSLGMSRATAIRRIILPQAFRMTLPPITNDFIALFKDSSIVSIIAMVELTKTYNILALSTLKFMQLGLATAFLYFAMSYPLSLFAKRLERRKTYKK